MKLRNKKTGSICEAYLIIDEPGIRRYAGSIKDLCNEYEDYKPTEPLIKDEKIRKAVKAWADADGADRAIYLRIDENGTRFTNKYGGYIEFAYIAPYEEGLYTIAQLCGEEEE